MSKQKSYTKEFKFKVAVEMTSQIAYGNGSIIGENGIQWVTFNKNRLSN